MAMAVSLKSGVLLMQPVGKWRIEEPVQEAPTMPVGKWSVVKTVVDTRDTETFQAHMMLDEAIAREDGGVAGQVSELLRPELVQAEGEVFKVYQGEKDKEGVLTAGIGHKLSPEELKRFSKDEPVSEEQVQAWFEQDSKKAVGAAVKQSEEIGVDSPEFMTALASVNFQLGANWNKIHTDTWKLMKEGKFEEAAEEAADSAWNDQTPDRVKAFQNALRSL